MQLRSRSCNRGCDSGQDFERARARLFELLSCGCCKGCRVLKQLMGHRGSKCLLHSRMPLTSRPAASSHVQVVKEERKSATMSKQVDCCRLAGWLAGWHEAWAMPHHTPPHAAHAPRPPSLLQSQRLCVNTFEKEQAAASRLWQQVELTQLAQQKTEAVQAELADAQARLEDQKEQAASVSQWAQARLDGQQTAAAEAAQRAEAHLERQRRQAAATLQQAEAQLECLKEQARQGAAAARAKQTCMQAWMERQQELTAQAVQATEAVRVELANTQAWLEEAMVAWLQAQAETLHHVEQAQLGAVAACQETEAVRAELEEARAQVVRLRRLAAQAARQAHAGLEREELQAQQAAEAAEEERAQLKCQET